MIYITGDIHGDQNRIRSIEEVVLKANDYLFVCGDFGFLFNNDEAEHTYLDELEKKNYTICFIDGNHENFDALNQFSIELWNGGKVHKIRNNVIHLMRGQVFLIEGLKFFTMGGAYSTDRYLREKYVSYWDDELPNESDYTEAKINLAIHDYQVDYVLTHTAPFDMLLKAQLVPNYNELLLNHFLRNLFFNNLTFKKWYCGHLHMDRIFMPNFRALYFDIEQIHSKNMEEA